jgi:two-component system chemotaxis response regulator CheB
MPGHDTIAIGASAGGIEALKEIVRGLPADLPAAVFVVVHIAAGSASVLPEILARHSELPVSHARDGMAIENGHIYIAPPDRHLLVRDRIMRLGRGPRENRSRPAVDPLFRSAARWRDGRTIGVVLSGSLDDGTAGLVAIKSHGGITVVQDPADALHEGMPQSALAHMAVDHVATAAQMAALLVKLVHQPALRDPRSIPAPHHRLESTGPSSPPDLAEGVGGGADEGGAAPEAAGAPSAFACPECGGPLHEVREGDLLRYRCRVGHAFSPESLQSSQSEAVESSLWTALQALTESALLNHQLARRARGRGAGVDAARFEARASAADAKARHIRLVLGKVGEEPGGFPADGAEPAA